MCAARCVCALCALSASSARARGWRLPGTLPPLTLTHHTQKTQRRCASSCSRARPSARRARRACAARRRSASSSGRAEQTTTNNTNTYGRRGAAAACAVASSRCPALHLLYYPLCASFLLLPVHGGVKAPASLKRAAAETKSLAARCVPPPFLPLYRATHPLYSVLLELHSTHIPSCVSPAPRPFPGARSLTAPFAWQRQCRQNLQHAHTPSSSHSTSTTCSPNCTD